MEVIVISGCGHMWAMGVVTVYIGLTNDHQPTHDDQVIYASSSGWLIYF